MKIDETYELHYEELSKTTADKSLVRQINSTRPFIGFGIPIRRWVAAINRGWVVKDPFKKIRNKKW